MTDSSTLAADPERQEAGPATKHIHVSSRFALATLSLVFLASWLSEQVVDGLKSAAVFNGFPADGPFQLYNPLGRIAAGQRVGNDFVYFHGPGIPYLHYPFFKLLGGDLHASELTRQLASPFWALIVALVFFRAITKRWLDVIALTGTAIATMFVFGMSGILTPGNSLLGERSAPPILGCALALSLARRARRPELHRWHKRFNAMLRRYPRIESRLNDVVGRRPSHHLFAVPVGICLGAELLLSTEQGIGAIAGMAVSILLFCVMSLRDRCRRALGAILTAGVTYVFVLFCLNHSARGVARSVKFNFVSVSHDQLWFFGGPPNPYVLNLTQLTGDWTVSLPIFGVILLISILAPLRRRGLLRQEECLGLASLLIYGLVSTNSVLGIDIGGYVLPCARTIIIGALAMAYLACKRIGHSPAPQTLVTYPAHTKLPSRIWRLRWTGRSAPSVAILYLQRWTAAILVVGVVVATPTSVLNLPGQLHSYVTRPHTLSAYWQTYLSQADAAFGKDPCPPGQPSNLWSTYAGLLEVVNHCVQPDTDYIIHALGPGRRKEYANHFAALRPEFAQSIRRSFFVYEDWLRSTEWGFYQQLYKNYQPVGSSGYSIFWKRNTPGAKGPTLSAPRTVSAAHNAATLPLPTGTSVVVVTLNYNVSNPIKKIPVLGQLPRVIVQATAGSPVYPQSVALDPAVKTFQFAFFVTRGATSLAVSTAIQSLIPGAGVTVKSLSYQTGRFPDTEAWNVAING